MQNEKKDSFDVKPTERSDVKKSHVTQDDVRSLKERKWFLQVKIKNSKKIYPSSGNDDGEKKDRKLKTIFDSSSCRPRKGSKKECDNMNKYLLQQERRSFFSVDHVIFFYYFHPSSSKISTYPGKRIKNLPCLISSTVWKKRTDLWVETLPMPSRKWSTSTHPRQNDSARKQTFCPISSPLFFFSCSYPYPKQNHCHTP